MARDIGRGRMIDWTRPATTSAPTGGTHVTQPHPSMRPDAIAPFVPTTTQPTQPVIRQQQAAQALPQYQPFQLPQFEPPDVNVLSLDEMMDIVNRRLELMIEGPKAQKVRGMEEERLAGERRRGAITDAHVQAQRDLGTAGEEHQRQAAESMRRRGIYDSGMAMGLSNQIRQQMLAHGVKIDEEKTKALGNLAEYLHLRERHTQEEINEMTAQKGKWASDLLSEMHMQERTRADGLEQQAFENWLRNQAMQYEIHQNNLALSLERQREQQRQAAHQDPSYSDIMNQFRLSALQRLQSHGVAGLSEFDMYLLYDHNPFAQGAGQGQLLNLSGFR